MPLDKESSHSENMRHLIDRSNERDKQPTFFLKDEYMRISIKEDAQLA